MGSVDTGSGHTLRVGDATVTLTSLRNDAIVLS